MIFKKMHKYTNLFVITIIQMLWILMTECIMYVQYYNKYIYKINQRNKTILWNVSSN